MSDKHVDSSPGTPKPATQDGLGQELTGGEVGRIIRYAAARILRPGNGSSTEQEDLEQELRLELLRRMNKYDPKRGNWMAFSATVVASQEKTLWRKRGRLARNQSLDHPSNGFEPLAANVPSNATEHRLGRSVRSPEELTQLRHDLAAAAADLSPELAALLPLLVEASVSEVARQLGIPRRTLRDRVQCLRRHLAHRDLHKYL